MKDVEVDPIPNCQVCPFAEVNPHPAEYDSPYAPDGGRWAYMCKKQFQAYGNPAAAFHLISASAQKEPTA